MPALRARTTMPDIILAIISQAIGVLSRALWCIWISTGFASLYGLFRGCKPHRKVIGPFWTEFIFVQVQRAGSASMLPHVGTHFLQCHEIKNASWGSMPPLPRAREALFILILVHEPPKPASSGEFSWLMFFEYWGLNPGPCSLSLRYSPGPWFAYIRIYFMHVYVKWGAWVWWHLLGSFSPSTSRVQRIRLNEPSRQLLAFVGFWGERLVCLLPFVLLFNWYAVSLCSLGWPGTCHPLPLFLSTKITGMCYHIRFVSLFLLFYWNFCYLFHLSLFLSTDPRRQSLWKW